MNYSEPIALAKAFTCPNCSTYAKQDWWWITWEGEVNGIYPMSDFPLRVAKCQHCEKSSVWVIDEIVYPVMTMAPLPNLDMPASVKKYYNEAALIFSKSPRGAAALLRLGIQVLCFELGEPGKNINTDIASLVSKGLPDIIQKSLDIVRVVGNESVHPGKIDTDDSAVVLSLFELMNLIVQYMITWPNQTNIVYNSLPADKIKGIEDRDKSRI